MDRRFIAVTGVLILAGLALAFAVAFIIGGESGRTEDIWLVRDTQSTQAPGQPSEKELDTVATTAPENETLPRPVVTTDWSNVSVRTLKILAHNQSAMLISPVSPDRKPGMMYLVGGLNDPETKTGALTPEQRKLAEKIALADTKVQAIVGAGMYNVDIQPLDRIQVKNSEEIPANGTGVSIVFTTVNTTTALNETVFFVHVDLDKEEVIRVSPLFPYVGVATGT
ncbi:MAG: hypothetical protein WCX63_04550 [Methanoregula sp.]|jgi:hypothetical protein